MARPMKGDRRRRFREDPPATATTHEPEPTDDRPKRRPRRRTRKAAKATTPKG